MRVRWASPRDWAISLRLVPYIASLAMRAGASTIRRRDVGREFPDACLAKGERIIVAFWHGRLLMMPFAAPGMQATILVSRHRDGEYIARIAQCLGFAVERGSATRGAADAFRKLIRALKEGRNVVITPDGPKGPVRRVKSGVVELSRLSGMPIVPLAFGARPSLILSSWDRFVIPYPCARCVYVWGPPLYVPPELARVSAAHFQSLLADRLDVVTSEADRLAASPAR